MRRRVDGWKRERKAYAWTLIVRNQKILYLHTLCKFKKENRRNKSSPQFTIFLDIIATLQFSAMKWTILSKVFLSFKVYDGVCIVYDMSLSFNWLNFSLLTEFCRNWCYQCNLHKLHLHLYHFRHLIERCECH